MKTVKFIKDLVVEEVPYVTHKEYIEYFSLRCDSYPALYEDGALLCDEKVEHRVVPVHHLFKGVGGAEENTAIAYSKEVQELLKIPFDCYQSTIASKDRQIATLNSQLSSLEKSLNKANHLIDGYELKMEEIKKMSLFERMFKWRKLC